MDEERLHARRNLPVFPRRLRSARTKIRAYTIGRSSDSWAFRPVAVFLAITASQIAYVRNPVLLAIVAPIHRCGAVPDFDRVPFCPPSHVVCEHR
jgi:hypothetical protein